MRRQSLAVGPEEAGPRERQIADKAQAVTEGLDGLLVRLASRVLAGVHPAARHPS